MRKLIDIYADWCQPCKQMAPVIEELKKEFTVTEIDADKDEELVQDLGVMSVPTYIVLEMPEGFPEKGIPKEIARFVGVTSIDKIREAMRE